MIINVSIVCVILASIYSIFYTYQRHKQLTCMAGMMIAMTVGMMTSITLGALLGLLFDHNLTYASMAAIIIGMIAGYLTGKPISLMAAMDGMMAGIMGGMMGAMLGVMLIPETADGMILFVDIIFVVIMYTLLKLIDEETGAKKKVEQEVIKSKTISSKLLIGTSMIFLLGVFLLLGKSVFFKDANTTNITPPVAVEQSNPGEQIATITISQNGYGPENVDLKAGVPTKIDFKAEKGAGCLRQVISKDLGINTIVDENKDNYVALKDVKPGTYTYTCGMGMFKGKITVR